MERAAVTFTVEITKPGPSDEITVRSRGSRSAETVSKLPGITAQELIAINSSICMRQPPPRALRLLGTDLFNAVFHGDVRDEFFFELGRCEEASHRNDPAVLHLLIKIDGVELRRLPWEFLYNARRDEFLALSPRTTLARSVGVGPVQGSVLAPPIRIGFLVSAPNDQPAHAFQQLELDELLNEVWLIHRALRTLIQSGQVVCEDPLTGGLEEFQERMQGPGKRLDVIHVIGHGCFRNSKGQLLLADAHGAGVLKEAAWFRAQIANQSTTMAVLNCCRTAVSGDLNLEGVASELSAAGIPAVIGMAFETPNDFAEQFAEHLYTAITRATSPCIDLCVREARILSLRGDPGNAPEWGLPVLFSPLAGQPLFEFSAASAENREPLPRRRARGGQENLAGAKLRDAVFEQRDLGGANFSNADLSGATFRDCDLRGARFDGAILAGAVFRNADLRSARFVGANLRGADLRAARIDQLNLTKADCRAAQFPGEFELVDRTIGWQTAIWEPEYYQRLRDASGEADAPAEE